MLISISFCPTVLEDPPCLIWPSQMWNLLSFLTSSFLLIYFGIFRKFWILNLRCSISLNDMMSNTNVRRTNSDRRFSHSLITRPLPHLTELLLLVLMAPGPSEDVSWMSSPALWAVDACHQRTDQMWGAHNAVNYKLEPIIIFVFSPQGAPGGRTGPGSRVVGE